MSETYVGSETLEPDGYLQPKRYRITCLCNRCGKEYRYTTTKLTAKDKPCPKKKCVEAAIREQVEKEQANFQRIVDTGVPPGHIGDKPLVRAVDETAKIVMEDHKMTDLRDNLRPGDAMAPKLPGQMQNMADNFFSKNPLADRGLGSRQAEMLKRRAIAGAFRGMAINPSQVVPGSTGQSPLRQVRTERLK